MSKIEELLKNEKVEWKPLGEICEFKRGDSITKKNIKAGNIPVVAGGQSPAYYHNESNRMGTNITVSGSGASAGYVGYWTEPIFVSDAFTVTPKSNLNIRYLYHWLSSIQHKIYNLQEGLGIPHVYSKDLAKLEIPIPSLETQEKIVKTLDKFTDYVTELQTELQTRTKQYEYYRDLLLSEEYLEKLFRYKTRDTGFNLRSATLGDIGLFTRGNGLQKKEFVEKGKPVIHYGEIYTRYGFATDKTISFVNENTFTKLRKAKSNDILIATTSENIEDLGKAVVWCGEEEIGFSGDMYSYKTSENAKYLAYYLQTNQFQKQKEMKITGTKLMRIHGDDMKKITILLPPLHIQDKVVEILDKFQSLLADTQGLLPQEIEQRQKQYEYYREKLLTFDSVCGRPTDRPTDRLVIVNSYFALLKEAADIVGVKLCEYCKKVSLNKIASIYDGTHKTPKYKNAGVPFISVENIKNIYGTNKFISYEDYKKYKYKPQRYDLFMTRIGDIGTCSIVKDDRDLAYYVTLALIKPNSEILLTQYLKFYIESIYGRRELNKRILHHANPIKINLGDIGKVKIVIPPLQVQEYIVSILDKFDGLVNDISQGLPKEIELRQKQYEYYRAKLLDFSRSNSTT